MGHSPSKHAAGEHEEDADHHVEPKLCGEGLGRFYLFLVGCCGYYSSDGIPDKRHPQCAPDIR